MNLAPGHMLLVDDNNKGLTIFAHKTSTFKFRNFFKLIKREGEILPEARRYIFINFDLRHISSRQDLTMALVLCCLVGHHIPHLTH